VSNGRAFDVIGDWRCPDPACDTCRLFEMPAGGAALATWLRRVREDVRNDPSVIGGRLEMRGLIAFREDFHEH
jgi:hypothetical protein